MNTRTVLLWHNNGEERIYFTVNPASIRVSRPNVNRVEPLALGSDTVDILAVDLQGRVAGEETVKAAQTIVDRERPVGADARVCAPAYLTVSVMPCGETDTVTPLWAALMGECFSEVPAALEA